MAQKETKKKLTYEQLENANKELLMKLNQVFAQLQKAEQFIGSINRLDYLLKVMENPKEYSNGFITQIKEEIEKVLTLPEPASAPEATQEEEK